MSTRPLPQLPPADRQPHLSASEVGAFAYCPRNWYLKRQRVEPTWRQARPLRQGTRAHQAIARRTESLAVTRRVRSALLLVALLLLLVVGILQVTATWVR